MGRRPTTTRERGQQPQGDRSTTPFISVRQQGGTKRAARHRLEPTTRAVPRRRSGDHRWLGGLLVALFGAESQALLGKGRRNRRRCSRGEHITELRRSGISGLVPVGRRSLHVSLGSTGFFAG